jgi:hypothetical protein
MVRQRACSGAKCFTESVCRFSWKQTAEGRKAREGRGTILGEHEINVLEVAQR